MTVAAASLITGTNHAAFQISKDVWNAHDHTFSDGSAGVGGIAFTSQTSLNLWRISTGIAGFSGSLAIKGPRPWYDVRAWGATVDGVTDDSAATTAVAAAINAAGSGTMFFSGGSWTIATGWQLNVPSTVWLAHDATINYTGSGVFCKLGPDGLTSLTFHVDPYIFHGGTVTGGASMTNGIFVNAWVTVFEFFGTQLKNFGNATGYAIHLEDENWDSSVHHFEFKNDTATPRNGIRVNAAGGRNSTRLRVNAVLMSNTGSGRGVGILMNGAHNTISGGSKIEGFSPNVIVDILATYCRIEAYFETLDNVGCIAYGRSGSSSTTVGLVVDKCYVNLHNTDLGYTGYFLYPRDTTNSGLQDTSFTNNAVIGPAAEPIQMTAKASQVGNYARDNIGYTTMLSQMPPLGTWQGSVNGLVRQGMVIAGTGQTTAAWSDSGATGGTLQLFDIGQAAGNGGTILFGFHAVGPSSLAKAFAAIKGEAVSGASNSTGDLAFSTRALVGDTALTRRMRLTVAGSLAFDVAATKILPGATSLSLRNNADSADNLIITDAGIVTVRAGFTLTAGNLTLSAAVSQIIPGATSFAVRNNANGANNILLADNGVATFRNTVKIGTNPASSGSLGVGNNSGVNARDAGNANDRSLIILNASDVVTVGSSAVASQYHGSSIGFFGVTPAARPSALTQTYSTTTRTHAADTATDMATTAATTTTPWGFATQAQADAIATKFNALRVDLDNLKGFVNAFVDDMQLNGLEQ